MSIQQMLLATGGGGGGGGIPTSNIWGVYSIAKLLSAYSGSAIRVRRSSDNAEQDIGFTGSVLDTTSLASFVGANSAYVTKMYDQSGVGGDLVQATSASQPRIVDAGVYDGFVRFDGSDDGFQSVNNSGTPTGLSMFIRGELRSPAGTHVYLEMFDDGVVNNGFLAYYGAGSARTQLYAGPLANRVGPYYSSNSLITEPVHAYRLDRSLANTNQIALWYNGTSLVPAGYDNGGSSTPSDVGSGKWNVGARANGTSLPSPLNLTTLLIYEAAKSDADMVTISGLI